MKEIPKVCDICGCATVEGDYGASWWICTNKSCKKNNPNWSFYEAFSKYKEKYNEYNNKITELSVITTKKFTINIIIHETRWLGDGSGELDIISSNSDNKIMFYLKNNDIHYSINDNELINEFIKLNLHNRLKKLCSLTMERNSIFKSIK